MDPQKPWEVPIGQPQAQPKLEQGMLEKLLQSLFGGQQPAPAPAPAAAPQGGGPVFSGDGLDELAEILKKQKQKAAILGGQPPPQ